MHNCECSLDEVQTYIFIDFETTGLINDHHCNPLLKCWQAGDKKRNTHSILKNFVHFSDDPGCMPRITEMSFVSVPRQLFIKGVHMMHAKQLQHEAKSNKQEEADAYQDHSISVHIATNVHTRQLNPEISEEKWADYQNYKNPGSIRLVKEELLTKNTFAEEWPGFHHMLKIAPKPACLIAHNGLRFDYRILMYELKRNQHWLEHYPLPKQVFFADSYLAFLDLEKDFHNSIKSTTNAVNWRIVTQLVLKATNHYVRSDTCFQLDNNNGFISRALLRKPANAAMPPKTPLRFRRSTSEQREVGGQQMEAKNPNKRCIKELFQEAHPLRFMTMDDWSPAKRKRLDAKVFERDNEGGWRFCDHLGDKYFSTYGNFKLGNIYRQVLGTNFDAHRAQEDSIALLQLCLAYGLEFVDYVDKNQAKFPELQPQNYNSMFERTKEIKTRKEKELTVKSAEHNNSEEMGNGQQSEVLLLDDFEENNDDLRAIARL